MDSENSPSCTDIIGQGVLYTDLDPLKKACFADLRETFTTASTFSSTIIELSWAMLDGRDAVLDNQQIAFLLRSCQGLQEEYSSAALFGIKALLLSRHEGKSALTVSHKIAQYLLCVADAVILTGDHQLDSEDTGEVIFLKDCALLPLHDVAFDTIYQRVEKPSRGQPLTLSLDSEKDHTDELRCSPDELKDPSFRRDHARRQFDCTMNVLRKLTAFLADDKHGGYLVLSQLQAASVYLLCLDFLRTRQQLTALYMTNIHHPPYQALDKVKTATSTPGNVTLTYEECHQLNRCCKHYPEARPPFALGHEQESRRAHLKPYGYPVFPNTEHGSSASPDSMIDTMLTWNMVEKFYQSRVNAVGVILNGEEMIRAKSIFTCFLNKDPIEVKTSNKHQSSLNAALSKITIAISNNASEVKLLPKDVTVLSSIFRGADPVSIANTVGNTSTFSSDDEPIFNARSAVWSSFDKFSELLSSWQNQTVPHVIPEIPDPHLDRIMKAFAESSEDTAGVHLSHEDAQKLHQSHLSLMSSLRIKTEALKYIAHWEASCPEIYLAYDSVIDQQQERIKKLSACVVGKNFLLYRKALSGPNTIVNELARCASERDMYREERDSLLSSERLFRLQNSRLCALADGFRDKVMPRPTHGPELDEILDTLSADTFIGGGAQKAKLKFIESLNKASNANLKMRKMDNACAQKLFMALAEHVRKNSGSSVFTQLVQDTCGATLGTIEPKHPHTDVSDPNIMTIVNEDLDWQPEEAMRVLLGTEGCESDYDFVIKESAISSQLASELKIPPSKKWESPLRLKMVDWRCVPSGEIALWKLQKNMALNAYYKLANLTHRLPNQGMADNKFSIPEFPNNEERADRVTAYIRLLHKQLNEFLDSAQILFPDTNISPHGPASFAVLLDAMTTLKMQSLASSKELVSEKQALALARKDLQEAKNLETKTSALLEGQESAIKSLQKKLAAKERDVLEKEVELKNLRESYNNRAEASNAEAAKAESSLVVMKEKFDKALKEPDKVRNEFFEKIQRLHEKARKAEQKSQVEAEAHNITRLDAEATLKENVKLKAEAVQFREKQKTFAAKAAKVKQENDELRASRVTQAQLDDTEASKIKKAVDDAVQPLEAKIVKLKLDKGRLEKSKDAVAAFQKANQLEETNEKLMEEVREMKENLTVLEDLQAKTRKENESLAKELMDERKKAAMVKKEGEAKAMQTQLDTKDAENKQLRDQLAAFLNVASMFQST